MDVDTRLTAAEQLSGADVAVLSHTAGWSSLARLQRFNDGLERQLLERSGHIPTTAGAALPPPLVLSASPAPDSYGDVFERLHDPGSFTGMYRQRFEKLSCTRAAAARAGAGDEQKEWKEKEEEEEEEEEETVVVPQVLLQPHPIVRRPVPSKDSAWTTHAGLSQLPVQRSSGAQGQRWRQAQWQYLREELGAEVRLPVRVDAAGAESCLGAALQAVVTRPPRMRSACDHDERGIISGHRLGGGDDPHDDGWDGVAEKAAARRRRQLLLAAMQRETACHASDGGGGGGGGSGVDLEVAVSEALRAFKMEQFVEEQLQGVAEARARNLRQQQNRCNPRRGAGGSGGDGGSGGGDPGPDPQAAAVWAAWPWQLRGGGSAQCGGGGGGGGDGHHLVTADGRRRQQRRRAEPWRPPCGGCQGGGGASSLACRARLDDAAASEQRRMAQALLASRTSSPTMPPLPLGRGRKARYKGGSPNLNLAAAAAAAAAAYRCDGEGLDSGVDSEEKELRMAMPPSTQHSEVGPTSGDDDEEDGDEAQDDGNDDGEDDGGDGNEAALRELFGMYARASAGGGGGGGGAAGAAASSVLHLVGFVQLCRVRTHCPARTGTQVPRTYLTRAVWSAWGHARPLLWRAMSAST
jgi:hypothetical protein